MICGAITNEIMKIITSWQEQNPILMNKPRADLGYEIIYWISHTLSQGLDVFCCVASDNHLRGSFVFITLVRRDNKSTQGKGQPDCGENERQCRGMGQRWQD